MNMARNYWRANLSHCCFPIPITLLTFCFYVFSCKLEEEKTDKYGNVEALGLAGQCFNGKNSLPFTVSLMLIFSSFSVCCLGALVRLGFWMHSLSHSCEGHGQWIMHKRVTRILKAMLFGKRKRKVSFHHCLRGSMPGLKLADWILENFVTNFECACCFTRVVSCVLARVFVSSCYGDMIWYGLWYMLLRCRCLFGIATITRQDKMLYSLMYNMCIFTEIWLKEQDSVQSREFRSVWTQTLQWPVNHSVGACLCM